MVMLETKSLTRYFGGLAAVDRVSIEVKRGEILGLIGPNGAGKTTLFNLLTGSLRPSRGVVIFNGEDITGLKPSSIAAKGMVRTFQASALFKQQTVVENVMVGCHLMYRAGFLKTLFNTAGANADEHEVRERARDIIRLTGLASLAEEYAGNLAHGHQRVLSIGVALAANPQLLLLDEPVAGSNPEESSMVMRLITDLRGRGLTIVLVEHDMRAVMGTCDRIVVLNYGRKIAVGTPSQIRENPDVIEAYLGVDEDAA